MLFYCNPVCDGEASWLVVSATSNVINYLKVCVGLFFKSCTHLRIQNSQPPAPIPAETQSCLQQFLANVVCTTLQAK